MELPAGLRYTTQPTLVEPLVRHVLLPRERLAANRDKLNLYQFPNYKLR
jgi:hypothetical protein